MRGWDLFKAILGDMGLYRRKLLVFLIMFGVGLGGYYLIERNQRVGAVIDYSSGTGSYANSINMDVTVSKNGQVTIDGKRNDNALSYLADYDELRIKVAHDEGSYINSFRGTVHLPEDDAANVRQIIYATSGVGSSSYSVQDSSTLNYSAQGISPQSIVTIVAYLPKGMVVPNSRGQIENSIKNLPFRIWLVLAIALPLISVIVMLFMVGKRRYGKVFIVRDVSSELPSHDPPAIVGALVDGNVGAREIASTLIDLARRKYIFIINKGNGNFSFGKRKAGDLTSLKELQPFERALLSKIFSAPSYKSTLDDVEMRIGRHIFSRKIASFYLDVYNQTTKKGYFVQNPAKVHLTYKYIGVALFFLSFIALELGAVFGAEPKYSLLFYVGAMIAAFFIIKLSPYMPARTSTGDQALRKWLAFRHYLVSRKSTQASDLLQGKLDEYLSYAIILGAEVEWTNRFLEEPFTKPDWYETPDQVLTMEAFVGEFFPFIGYVADNLAKSHEPTVE